MKSDIETASVESSGLLSRLSGLTSFWKKRGTDEPATSLKEPSPEKTSELLDSDTLATEFARVLKFEKLLESHPRSHSKLVQECKAGIPDLIRPALWKVLLGIPANVDLWYTFMTKDKLLGEKSSRQISVDIARCHQYNRFLNTELGRQRLEHVLKLWLELNPDLCYVQGMDSLCAPFIVLYQDSVASAYSCFAETISKYLHSYCMKESAEYLKGQLLVFRNLLNFIDPDLALHFATLNFSPDCYAIPWILTLYAHVFPIKKLFRLWDELFLNDSSVILYIGIAILQQFRTELLKADELSVSQLVLNMPGYVCLKKCIESSKAMHRASPTTITNLNVDPTSQINVDRWWESYIPIEIAAETTSPFIDVNETIEIKDRLTFIDIRSKDDFRESHIENSITIPAVVLESGDLLPTLEEPLSFITHLKTALPPFSIVVIVGDKTLCANAFAKILSRHGCKYVCILRGGFDAVLADA